MTPATKHTPGPWRVGDAGHTVFGPPNGNPSPETIAPCGTRANALLIAAAPDMLAALKASLGAMDALRSRLAPFGPDAAEYISTVDSASFKTRAAIAKAEGGKS